MIFDATIVLIAISDLIVSLFIDLNASDAFTVMRLWRLVRSRKTPLGESMALHAFNCHSFLIFRRLFFAFIPRCVLGPG